MLVASTAIGLDVGLTIAAIVLFACAAGLAVAEVSLVRVRRSRVEADATAGDQRSRRLLGLIDDLPVVLNTILLLVLLCQVGLATIGGFLAQRWIGGVGVTVGSLLLTLLLFVYAEAIPKTAAVRAPTTFARRVTPVVRPLVAVCRPVVLALVRLADLQSGAVSAEVESATEDELLIMTRASAEAGAIDERDADLVERSFVFTDRQVSEAMVPVHRIAAVASDRSVEDVVSAAIAVGHRRLPVTVGDDLDQVVGVIRLRDAAALAREAPDTPASEAMTDVLRCVSSESVAELVERMQRRGRWLAIVADTAGRTVGLVTIEDLVAELLGEIADERAAPPPPESNPPERSRSRA